LSSCQLPDQAPAIQDLGSAVSNATGLKGSLNAHWQSTSAQYELEIEPIHPLDSAGFSYVASNPPGPLSLHMRLLDAAGYSICGKDVLFPFHSSSRAEADRERGQDLLQTKVDDDGKVISLGARGTLPCTQEQYSHVSYWDFSTNFPPLAEQDRLAKLAADAKRKQDAQKRKLLAQGNAPPEGDEQANAPQSSVNHGADAQGNPPRSNFYMEGDERVTKYDASHNVLETKLGGESFQVTGPAQQATARQWADDHVLFHYKCDQHSDCVLASAGGGETLSATALQ
jgi:hypothetical protein